MQIKIRKAEEQDLEQVYLLIKEFATFIKTPEKVLITPEQMVKNQHYFNCLVACYNHKIIGFATSFNAFYSWTGKAIYLDDLFVQEQYRGKGIGKQLFNSIIEKARAEKCIKVKWQVSNWNNKAIDFYKKMGATIDSIEINCDLIL
jgi:GNAT superfamily N-acetyltransferase